MKLGKKLPRRLQIAVSPCKVCATHVALETPPLSDSISSGRRGCIFAGSTPRAISAYAEYLKMLKGLREGLVFFDSLRNFRTHPRIMKVFHKCTSSELND